MHPKLHLAGFGELNAFLLLNLENSGKEDGERERDEHEVTEGINSASMHVNI